MIFFQPIQPKRLCEFSKLWSLDLARIRQQFHDGHGSDSALPPYRMNEDIIVTLMNI